MKKILIAYGILVIVVAVLAFAKFNGFNFFPNFSKSTTTIQNKTYNVMLAKDDKSRQIGLSEKKSLKENEGMLFIFDKAGKYSFWMKDTQIPLDIIYINNDTIVYIAKNAKPQKGNKGPLPIYTPTKDANFVLEISGGQSDKYKFKEGDKVTLKNVK